MQMIRKIFFTIFACIGALFLIAGVSCLNKRQRITMELLLEEIKTTVEGFRDEAETIEDKMLKEQITLTKKDYIKGINQDLSVECRMCGEITPRGKFYKRVDAQDNNTPYLVICEKCYRWLED